jgi:hypothetical protein
MSYEEETQNLECLFEALYPELFPGTPLCSETHVHYSEAIEKSERCRNLAGTFKDHLAQIRERVLEPQPDKGELANKLFIEVSSSGDLWNEALALIDACEEWSTN